MSEGSVRSQMVSRQNHHGRRGKWRKESCSLQSSQEAGQGGHGWGSQSAGAGPDAKCPVSSNGTPKPDSPPSSEPTMEGSKALITEVSTLITPSLVTAALGIPPSCMSLWGHCLFKLQQLNWVFPWVIPRIPVPELQVNKPSLDESGSPSTSRRIVWNPECHLLEEGCIPSKSLLL